MKWTLVILSFIVFGLLGTASSVPNPGLIHWGLGLLIAVTMAGIALGLNIGLLSALNPDVRKKHGSSGVVSAIIDGHLYMLPFLVLAIISTVVLRWQSSMVFASAAVMIGGATAGAEMVKKGAKGVKNMMIPSGVGFIVTMVWMAMLSLVSRL